jgi:Filamin/ABP280 repeat
MLHGLAFGSLGSVANLGESRATPGTPRCTLRGAGLHGFVVGRRAALLLSARDRHGNARAVGGEDVTLNLSGPEGSSASRVAVVDNGNGTYSCEVFVDRAGRWLLHPRCDVHQGPCGAVRRLQL